MNGPGEREGRWAVFIQPIVRVHFRQGRGTPECWDRPHPKHHLQLIVSFRKFCLLAKWNISHQIVAVFVYVAKGKSGKSRIRCMPTRPDFLECSRVLKRVNFSSIEACLLFQLRRVYNFSARYCWGGASGKWGRAWSPGNQLLRYLGQAASTHLHHCILHSVLVQQQQLSSCRKRLHLVSCTFSCSSLRKCEGIVLV